MIDTIQFQIPEFQVADVHKLEIVPGSVHGATGEIVGEFPLWQSSEDEWVCARRAFVNTDQFSVDIKGTGSSVSCFFKIHSVAKAIDGGLGLASVDRSQAVSFFDQIEAGLSACGIHADPLGAAITRLDLFRDVETEFPFAAYRPVLEHLEPYRTRFKSDYGTTYTWGNGRQQICVYDKIAERQARGADVSALPSHLIRFEYRLTSKAKVHTQLGGIYCLGNLLDRFEILPGVFNQAMQEELFRHPIPDRPISATLTDELTTYQRTGGRNWQQRYLADQGLIRLHERLGLRAAAEALVDVTGDRRKAKRTLEQGFNALLHQTVEGLGIRQLYRELKEKVIWGEGPEGDAVDAVLAPSRSTGTGVAKSNGRLCHSPRGIPRGPPWSVEWKDPTSMQ